MGKKRGSMNHAYYNEIDAFCCKVLRKNIDRGYLPEGRVDERDIREVRAEDFMGYQHIHLFAGIGGFPLGMARAGYPSSIRTITGGFPCQDISNAGRREGITGERSGLWKEMYRLIKEAIDLHMGPDIILLENVSALVNRGLSTVLGDLAQIGLDARWQCLRASDFGAPHQRERIFIVAHSTSRREWEHQATRSEERAQSFDIQSSARRIESGLDRESHGLSARMDRSHRWPARHGEPQYNWEPPRNVIGKQLNRAKRLKALGNAIVPQCVEYVARCVLATIGE